MDVPQFAIHSPVEELWSCFSLIITNKMPMNSYVVVFGHMLIFLLVNYLGVGWLNHMIGVYLTF